MPTSTAFKGFPSQAQVIPFDKISSVDIDWLWPNHIPLGTLTLIAGDPGVGKSFLTLFIASAVSTGGPWPDAPSSVNRKEFIANNPSPGSVLIINSEDSPPRTMRPRLLDLNADLSKIMLIPSIYHRDSNGTEYESQFNIITDLFALELAMEKFEDLKLIIIDPIVAFFGQYDTRSDSYVRNVLSPLKKLAAKYNVAVIGVMHLNKGSSSKAVYRTMGALAFSSCARSIWLVSSIPNNAGIDRRLFIPVKNNMLEKPSSLAFEIKDNRVIFENQPVKVTADFMLSPRNIESPELNRAIDWLINLLADGKPKSCAEILKLSESQFFRNRTIQRAKKEIGIVSFPDFDKSGNKLWYWKLPEVEKLKENKSV